jgi:hypothetical protein
VATALSHSHRPSSCRRWRGAPGSSTREPAALAGGRAEGKKRHVGSGLLRRSPHVDPVIPLNPCTAGYTARWPRRDPADCGFSPLTLSLLTTSSPSSSPSPALSFASTYAAPPSPPVRPRPPPLRPSRLRSPRARTPGPSTSPRVSRVEPSYHSISFDPCCADFSPGTNITLKLTDADGNLAYSSPIVVSRSVSRRCVSSLTPFRSKPAPPPRASTPRRRPVASPPPP